MNNTRPSEYKLPTAGEVVAGKYRVVSIIGTGGMGVVLGAVDLSLGRKVAIKFLAPSKAGRQGATARFGREARAAASIQSENVVRVFDVGTLPTGASYIVMEHLIGADLALTLQRRGPLPVEEAVDYVLQACEAIGEAHGRGIIHRDLKPQNLFLTHLPSGRACVKVLDFGIAKATHEDASIITLADMIMGTPLYMSPEQMRSLKSVDWRSDIWALGAILFELLTASPVFDAETTAELCAMIGTEAPIPLRRLRPEAPAALEAAILRCLHKDPNGRFQDIATLAEALLPFASERGRVSATWVPRVLRAGGPQEGVANAPVPTSAPTAAGSPSAFDTTSDVNDVTKVLLYAPCAPPPSSAAPPSSATVRNAGGGSSFPPLAVPTTQQSWQPPSTRPKEAEPPRRSSSAIVVALGMVAGTVAGVVGLGLMAGGYFAYSKSTSTKGATGRASAFSAASAAPNTADAASATTADPKDPQLEAEKLSAQVECSQMESLLRSNDGESNTQAKQVKGLVCPRASGPQGTTCLRASCRSACSTLQDKPCLLQLESGERAFPARF